MKHFYGAFRRAQTSKLCGVHHLPLVFFGSSALGGTGIMLLFGWFGFGVTTKFESEKTTFLKQIFLKHAVN